MMGRSAALAVALVLPSIALLAHEPPTPPVFKSKTEVVLVDCVVTDKSGRPVHGLTVDDFVVEEDGRDRPIVTFTAFDGGTPSPPAPSPAAPERRSGPTGRRRSDVATVLLVDDGNLSPQEATRLRPVLKQLVARLGDRGGTLSIVAPWSKVSVANRLPGGVAALTAALDRIVGKHFDDHSSFPVSDAEALGAMSGDVPTVERLTSRFLALNPDLGSAELAGMYAHNRAAEVAYDARKRRDVFYGVASLALDWLANKSGRHSLLVASGGFAREPSDFGFNEIVTRSMRVNAPISFVDVRGLQGVGLQGVEYGPALSQKAAEAPFAFAEAAEGMSGLADETGGIVVNNTNDLEASFGRLIDMMETYYVLGYEPPADARQGFRKVKVTTKSPDRRVLARKGYFVAPPRGK